MTARPADVVVIGGGPNGLVAAGLLARSGRRVLLLEAAAEPGGMAANATLCPGFRVPRLAHLLHALHPEVIRALDPGRHGLDLTAPAAPTMVLGDGGPVTLAGAWGELVEGVPAAEARAFAALRARALLQAAALRPFLAAPPPEYGAIGREAAGLAARAGLALRRRGAGELREFLRMVLIAAWDAAEEALGDPRLRALVLFDATLGGPLGPRAPTTWLGLLHRLAGDWGGAQGAACLPAGGMGAVAEALAGAARAAGAEIRCAAPVRRIAVAGGRVAGVETAAGEAIPARAVLAAIAPQRALLDLLGARHLGTDLVRDLRRLRALGTAAKLNLALDGVPEFDGIGVPRGRLVLCGTPEAIDRAAAAAKYGGAPAEPVLEVTLPGAGDGRLAPPGASVLSAVIPFVAAGADRAALMAAALRRLEAHAPGLRRRIRHAELLMPGDIAALTGAPGGAWSHADMTADQLLGLRPAHGIARYRGPVPGLWLSGAGTHPGGGVSGLPGLLAARALMEAPA